ncbi:hypothetical protein O7602_26625 [Micromonospora sp. WMMD1128]|uniref:hypothetical protein n=1 Tax=Micromonospora sp. WMMD1128 TaxID=3015150 RepID=UPI00248D0123|nr:hypothetical protein [Micromonospora sp. WMMD1128]WBB73219.1 hypothetical protein O7602_26625 [Micromonospora sp. WMMD1128]
MAIVGIQFISPDGSVYDPDSDDRHAAWLAEHRPDRVAQFAELRAAYADRPAWRSVRRTGYASHAITIRREHVAIVIGEHSGWWWQVYRVGGSRPVRDIHGTPAATAAEAMRLADEVIDRRRAR